MINIAHPDAPLSNLTDTQLLGLVKFPVLLSGYLFELYSEINRRQVPGKINALDIIRQHYKKARERELELELLAMDGEFSESFHSLGTRIEGLKSDLRCGKYPSVLNCLADILLLEHEKRLLLPDGGINVSLKKSDAIDLCGKIFETVRESRRKLTRIQRQAYSLVENIEKILQTEQKPKPDDAVKKSVNISVIQASKGSIGASSWQDTLKQVRHGRLHPDAKKISRLQGSGDWADASPLKMLGYSVNSKEGLPEKERHELLKDFCERADLPRNLPLNYTRPWGEANSYERIIRTARHLGFIRRNFERQDSVLYARAIECWRKDFEFLERNYADRLTRLEWEQARKGI